MPDNNPRGVPKRNILDLRSRVVVTPKKDDVEKIVTAPRFETPKKQSKKRKAVTEFLKEKKDQTRQFTKRNRIPDQLQRPIVIRIRALKGLIAGAAVIALGLLAINLYSTAKETKAEVTASSEQGLYELQQAEDLLLVGDRETMRQHLYSARASFSRAKESINNAEESFGVLLKIPGVDEQYKEGSKLVDLGLAVSSLGIHLDELVATIEQQEASGFIAFFTSYATHGSDVRQDIEQIHVLLEAIDPSLLTSEYQESFLALQKRYDPIYQTLRRVDDLASVFQDVLGFEEEKTYLLIFQNNQELRATGGFIGSLAEATFEKGEIEKLLVPEGGSYDISGQVTRRVRAPKPLQIVNPYFSFQDLNWFPSFPQSAEKILSFYEEAGNEPVDGIISLTPDVILSFLALTGPVDLPGEDDAITEESFLRVLREDIEEKKEAGSNKPKKLIADLMPVLLEKVFTLSPAQQIDVAITLDDALRKKDILIYAKEQKQQTKLEAANIAGVLKPQTTDDMLAVVASNIAGGKTSRHIHQHIGVETNIHEGKAMNTVTVTWQHSGISGDPFSGSTNLSYLRFYVPDGAVLIDAQGFYKVPDSWFQEPPANTPYDEDLIAIEQTALINEINGTRTTKEDGFTVFGNWIHVEAGKSVKAVLTYEVPLQDAQSTERSFFIAKQPGVLNTFISWSYYDSRGDTSFKASVPIEITTEQRMNTASFDLTEDAILGAELVKR